MNESLIPKTKFPKFLFIIGATAVAFFVIVTFVYASFFSAPQRESEQFTITVGNDNSREIAEQLKEQGFIKNKTAFQIVLLGLKGIYSIL
jgi:cell division protein YceG involved in septum cleavage